MAEVKRNLVMISALMEKAECDPMLRARLLTDPEGVAAEYKVSFDPQETEYLRRVGDLHRLVDELRAVPKVPGPVFYPADTWWTRKFVQQVSKIRTLPRYYPIGYYLDLARFRELALADSLRNPVAAAGAILPR